MSSAKIADMDPLTMKVRIPGGFTQMTFEQLDIAGGNLACGALSDRFTEQ